MFDSTGAFMWWPAAMWLICILIYIFIFCLFVNLRDRKRFMNLFCNGLFCLRRLREMANDLHKLFQAEIERRMYCVEMSLDQDRDGELREFKFKIRKAKKDFWRAASLAQQYFNVPTRLKYTDYLN